MRYNGIYVFKSYLCRSLGVVFRFEFYLLNYLSLRGPALDSSLG